MATYKETFDTQIQKFKDLKEERDQDVRELESSRPEYKELMSRKRQIFDIFSVRSAELRSNPDYKQAQKLRSAYLVAKKAYESEGQNESETGLQADFMKICENLKSFAESMQEEGNNLIHKMLIAGVPTAQINETFYRKGQDILTYFKDFRSGWSNNIYEEKEKNNNIVIQQLGLKEVFNKIYDRCTIFSDKYKNAKTQGIQYFDIMIDTLKNIESELKYFGEERSQTDSEGKY